MHIATVSRRDFYLKSTTSFIALFSAMTNITAAGSTKNEKYGIEGRVAPEIELDSWIDADGNNNFWSITEQRGKWVYLYCFQDWCSGCHAHGFPALKKLSDAFPNSDVISIAAIQTVFEGFLVNTQSDVKKLQQQYALPISMAHDAGSAIGDHRPQTMKKYNTGGTPWTIIINPHGIVVFNDYHIQIDNFIQFIQSQEAQFHS